MFFVWKKCQLKDINELLVLTLARKESVAEIVQFYGAKLKGKSAFIFMEFMKGERLFINCLKVKIVISLCITVSWKSSIFMSS